MNKYILLLLACLAFSCMNPEPIVDEPHKDSILTDIAIKNEIEITSFDNISFAEQVSPDDLFAFSVQTKKSTTQHEPYAYGLFDTQNTPPLKLIVGDVYKIECTVIKNGKNIIHKDLNGYHSPFKISVDNKAGRPTLLTSDFQYNVPSVFEDLFTGTITTTDNNKPKVVDYPQIDRYCAEVDDFKAAAGSKINIELKRTIFGIIPRTEGLTKGRIEITIGSSSTVITLLPENETESEVEYLFSLANKTGSGNIVNSNLLYTEPIKIHVKKFDQAQGGTSTNITPQTGKPIIVKRKSSYPIMINLKPASSEISNIISFEDPTLIREPQIVI